MTANAGQSATAFPTEQYRPCHACGMLVRVAAVQCRFCGAETPPGDSLAVLVERASAKLRSAAAQEAKGIYPHREARWWGRRIGIQTLLAALFAGPSLAALFLPHLYAPAGSIPSHGEIRIYGFLVAIIAVPAFGRFLQRDLSPPCWAACTNPKAAVRAFFNAMLVKRWRYAYALLMSAERNMRQRRRPAIETLHAEPETVSFENVESFTTYWAPLAGSSPDVTRHCSFRAWEVDRIDGENAIARGIHRADSHRHVSDGWKGVLFVMTIACFRIPALFFVTVPLVLGVGVMAHLRSQGKAELELIKWLHRVGDHWYVVSGEIFTGEDMLPKLYFDCMETLQAGAMLPDDVLARAAGFTGVEAMRRGEEDDACG